MARITAYHMQKGDFKVVILATKPEHALKIAKRALARKENKR